jgi:protein subunit release factor B
LEGLVRREEEKKRRREEEKEKKNEKKAKKGNEVRRYRFYTFFSPLYLLFTMY